MQLCIRALEAQPFLHDFVRGGRGHFAHAHSGLAILARFTYRLVYRFPPAADSSVCSALVRECRVKAQLPIQNALWVVRSFVVAWRAGRDEVGVGVATTEGTVHEMIERCPAEPSTPVAVVALHELCQHERPATPVAQEVLPCTRPQ